MIKINNTNITDVYKGTDVINKIYRGTELVYEKDVTQEKNLRNIQKGDDLSGKTLYCEIPDTFYNECEGFSDVITSYDYMIHEVSVLSSTYVEIQKWGESNTSSLYAYVGGELTTNLKTFVLPDDFGEVSTIYESSTAYKYLKIEA